VASLVGGAAGAPIARATAAPNALRADPADLRAMIQATIHAVAGAGQAVIVAHAASMALAGAEGVLRVLVTASAPTRIRRLAERERLVPEEAERRIAASDRERREYFERFYKLPEELATHYDVVLNTDVLSPPQAVTVVLAAAQG
jgi:cytidylate kinase